ncbi:MAG: hypothetical protein NC253_09770 [Ruminococcus sp.]|nr:hypothetical protein [Ruminococcus sp.]MCM1478442.1 hypothetical protein [Muribaculaceae bacterium]
MGALKKILFWVFHTAAKILPAATAFLLSGGGLAEFSSGAFYNIYLLAGYIFAAFAVVSCFIDYKLIQKDRESAFKKILIIDGIVFLAGIALYVNYLARGAYFYGMSFWEFAKEFNFFYLLGAE